jgi:hypothetical protein
MHVFVISWKDQHQNAVKIVAALLPVVESLTLVYSDPNPKLRFKLPCQVIQRPDHLFWGDKFTACLEQFHDDIMLIIQADASCDNWAGLVTSCKNLMHTNPQVGLWAPQIEWSPYDVSITQVAAVPDSTLRMVVQTDGIVLGMSRQVVNRLKQADLSYNTYGWGIDQLATAFAYANNMMAVVDTAIKVQHPKSRGYPEDEAGLQWQQFMSKEMTAQEKILHKLLFAHLMTQNRKHKHLAHLL